VPPDPDRILSDFIDAWNAGHRPDVDEHLARAAEPDRKQLLADITSFVAFAPTPDYDDAALAAIRAEPVVASAHAATTARAGLWPALLPRLRERAAVSTSQLAEQIVAALGLPSDRKPKTRGYLEQLEAGELEPQGLSGRLLDTMARLLGVPRGELEGAGGFGAPASAALFRAEGPAAETARDDLDVLADALAAPSGAHWDEVDELFRSGER
jgi:hypothetical protein